MFNDIKAVIFDMDGVISDTTDTHLKIQTQFTKKYKVYSSGGILWMK
jgi:beta-phosphoglucomutase-like phosphatase (HAD superfamily)